MKAHTERKVNAHTGGEVKAHARRQVNAHTGRDMKANPGRQVNAHTGEHAARQSGSAGRQLKAHTGTSKCAHWRMRPGDGRQTKAHILGDK